MRALRYLGLVVLAASLAGPASGAAREAPNAPVVAATAPSAEARTYAQPADALLAADLDYLVTDARRNFTAGDHTTANGLLVFLDEMAAGRPQRARAVLAQMPDGATGDVGDLFEPYLLLAENRTDRALERSAEGNEALPGLLPEISTALVLEAANRLPAAADTYARIIADLDTSGPLEGEPRSVDDVTKMLNATRTMHTLYRAALVNHRLHRNEEAARLYGFVSLYAPNAPDVALNRARLARGEDPFEPALDAKRALGRWLMFLSDHLAQTEGLAAVLTSDGPVEGLASPSGAMFLQFGLLLDPSADDWRLGAAQQLYAANGYDGAQRLAAGISATGPFAAEAELSRAQIALAEHEDEAAIAAAGRAVALGGDRWTVLTGAGDVYRTAGRASEANAVLDRALTLVSTEEDRADVLRYRAYAHRFAGELAPAVADARAAYALDQSDDTRILYVSILMDDRQAWRDGVTVARALFAERPNSVTRLNTLGYALIQRPEGLEEGYRLLWRGFLLGERDYAVIDSLGWAYYLHGAFDQARALIETANELTGSDKNPEVLDHLGDVYWRLDRQEDARAQWRAALQERPDALRRADLNAKIEHGLTSPAPRQRRLPEVQMPTGQSDNT